MNPEYAIEARKLAKSYTTSANEQVHAVRGIDLAVRTGEIYALLGPNGAGKTTTLSILTTLLTPSSGEAYVAGFDVVTRAADVRRNIGVTFQEVVLDEALTGRRVLDFHAQLYGQARRQRKERIEELAALVELDGVLDRPVKTYSGGMKRRLELARGLMTSPRVLFLDEPTQGLDPHNRAGIWRYIRQLRDEHGIALLLTTHYMDEAQALADRVGIIDHGKLIVEGVPADLARAMGADVVSILGMGDLAAFSEQVSTLAYVSHVVQHQQADQSVRIQIGVDHGERRLADLVGLAAAQGFHIHEVSAAKPSLADVFLAYTGHELRD